MNPLPYKTSKNKLSGAWNKKEEITSNKMWFKFGRRVIYSWLWANIFDYQLEKDVSFQKKKEKKKKKMEFSQVDADRNRNHKQISNLLK